MTETDEYLRHALIRWECCRIFYNLAILACALPLTYPLAIKMGAGIYLAEAFCFALAANFCYCLGPLTECYLLAFGVRIQNFRYALFALGLGLSLLVTLLLALLSQTQFQ